MSYELNALIATEELIAVVVAEVPLAHAVALPHGLALVPMTDELHEALQHPSNAPDFGFKRFPSGFALRIAGWSKAAPIAYAEADPEHPAGRRAALWYDGRIILGPLAPADGPPLDHVLRALGTPAEAVPDITAALAAHRDGGPA
ncbi:MULTISPECIES: hypothetical protein [Kitasatospora]|uniref:Uncharacterized protein n=1 Tax=Kitasatospora setae (strain ATCC 33774 / DSM 43861 / JCM 3304 / KCC A-0304 / NBRC 14216 / KM-6054) TaxID=452652 RepID=E4NCX7_KITSK|nr:MULTISPECIES: hypothetical protein [Kitasatospora]BAJ29058.1 hypothetical protein KSE_32490 [Kitasatospora setae KM-6054]